MKNMIELRKGMTFEDSKMHKMLELLESKNERFQIETGGGHDVDWMFAGHAATSEMDLKKGANGRPTAKKFHFTMVGGAVIDTILGLKPNDYDIHVEEHQISIHNGDCFISKDMLIEDWFARNVASSDKWEIESNCYNNISKVLAFNKFHFLVDFYGDLDFMVSKFDIAIKMFTYDLENGLQWGHTVEQAILEGEIGNPYNVLPTPKEIARLEKAEQRYGKEIERLFIGVSEEEEVTLPW